MRQREVAGPRRVRKESGGGGGRRGGGGGEEGEGGGEGKEKRGGGGRTQGPTTHPIHPVHKRLALAQLAVVHVRKLGAVLLRLLHRHAHARHQFAAFFQIPRHLRVLQLKLIVRVRVRAAQQQLPVAKLDAKALDLRLQGVAHRVKRVLGRHQRLAFFCHIMAPNQHITHASDVGSLFLQADHTRSFKGLQCHFTV
jgi:hypothetical protein